MRFARGPCSFVNNSSDAAAVVESRDSRTPLRWSGTSFLNVPQLLRRGFKYKANGLTWEVGRAVVGNRYATTSRSD